MTMGEGYKLKIKTGLMTGMDLVQGRAYLTPGDFHLLKYFFKLGVGERVYLPDLSSFV